MQYINFVVFQCDSKTESKACLAWQAFGVPDVNGSAPAAQHAVVASSSPYILQLRHFPYCQTFVLVLTGILRTVFVDQVRRGGEVEGRQAQVQGAPAGDLVQIVIFCAIGKCCGGKIVDVTVPYGGQSLKNFLKAQMHKAVSCQQHVCCWQRPTAQIKHQE